jgi:hypothetical protein
LITTDLKQVQEFAKASHHAQETLCVIQCLFKYPIFVETFFSVPANKYLDVTTASFQVASHPYFAVRPTVDVTSNSEIVTASYKILPK